MSKGSGFFIFEELQVQKSFPNKKIVSNIRVEKNCLFTHYVVYYCSLDRNPGSIAQDHTLRYPRTGSFSHYHIWGPPFFIPHLPYSTHLPHIHAVSHAANPN